MHYVKWLTVVSIAAIGYLLLRVLLRRDVPKMRFFRLLLFAGIIYLLGYCMEIFAPSYDAAYYAVVIEYLGVPYIAPLTLLFVLDLHNYAIKKWHALLLAYPVIQTVLVITWPLNGIFYGGANFKPGPPISYLHVDTTLPHTLAFVYMFVLMFVALCVVAWHFVKEGRATFRRELLVLVALFCPFIGLVLYFTSVVPYDITAIGMAISDVIIYYSVFRFNQVNMIPLVRGRVLEDLEDAYLMVDDEWRYFDANHQAKLLFPELCSVVYGASLPAISSEIASLRYLFDAQREFVMERDGVSRSYRISKTQVDIGNSKPCTCIMLYENTEAWKRMGRLQHAAEHDGLTGVYNRHAFTERAQAAFNQAKADGAPMAIMMFDLDNFKNINDTYGHQLGDMVLREVAQLINSRLRQSDVFGRYGGEEFCACMPGLGNDDAVSVANNLRKIVQKSVLDHKGVQVSVTVSIGVCIHDVDTCSLEEMLEKADIALYMAKADGRNRARVFEEE